MYTKFDYHFGESFNALGFVCLKTNWSFFGETRRQVPPKPGGMPNQAPTHEPSKLLGFVFKGEFHRGSLR